MTDILPLDDLRIVEVDNWMAAPSALAVLADLGAEVIKIEPLTGDPMRRTQRPPKLPDGPAADFDYGFNMDNRGKKSVAVDLSVPAGGALVARLCESADIFACNLLPERQQRFGLDAASLHAVNPKLVHATFTGFGTAGPEAGRRGFDATVYFARGGVSSAMQDGKGGTVPWPGTAQGDHASTMSFVGAILAGLRLAERTGEGQIVESSLLASAAWSLASDLSLTLVDGYGRSARGRTEKISPVMNSYPTGDGKWVFINMPRADDWADFCRAVGQEDWLTREGWQSGRDRYQNMPEVVAEIESLLATKSRAEWAEVFDAGGVVWGPVQSVDELAEDPQAAAAGLFPTIDSEIGEFRTVAAPFQIHNTAVGPKQVAPSIGQDTAAVLRGAGFSEDEISGLAADRVIGIA